MSDLERDVSDLLSVLDGFIAKLHTWADACQYSSSLQAAEHLADALQTDFPSVAARVNGPEADAAGSSASGYTAAPLMIDLYLQNLAGESL